MPLIFSVFDYIKESVIKDALITSMGSYTKLACALISFLFKKLMPRTVSLLSDIV